jgi:heat-inducible transcriptional repressor
LDTASLILAELTNNLAFAGTVEEIYSHGLSNLFSYPELLAPGRVSKTAELVDNLSYFLRELPDNFDTRVYVGSEVPIGKTAGCSVVVAKFLSPEGHHGYLGIVGPTRMGYEESVSAINEIKRIMEERYEQKRLKS